MSVHPRTIRQLPSAAVLGVVALGLLLAALVDWQLGAVVIGLGMLLGAGLRLTLPSRSGGWLVVRTRAIDAAFLLVVGFALIALAASIPEP